MFVLLTTAAPARIVAAGAFLTADGPARSVAIPATGMYGSHLPRLRCGNYLGPVDGVYNVVLDCSQQLVIHFVRFAFECNQWVLLAECSQANSFT
jgi:hypothetical protein